MEETTQPLRAGNLGRVSHDNSGVERSVDEQQDRGRAEIAAHGWAIAAEYEDATSASRFATKARKDWPRLLDDVDGDRLDVVVMWDPSRGSREPEDWFGFLRRCRDHKVLIHITTHGRSYDMANPRDWRTLADDGIDSAYESEKKSRDVRRALEANAAAGLPHSQPPYGYERVHDPRTGKLDREQSQRPVPGRAEVARRIIEAVAAAVPISQIERETGIRRSTIRKIATNPAYIAKRRTAAGLVDAKWPAIVAEETWHTAQAVLAGRPGTGKATRPGSVKYLLSSIMLCAPCRKPVEPDPPSARRRAAYSCRTGHVTAAMAGIDEAVLALTAARCAQDDLWALLTAASGADAERARAEAVSLQAELDEWLSAGVSPRAYKAQEDRLLPLIGAARDRAEALTIPSPVRELAIPGADAASVLATLKAMPVAAQRMAVRFLFQRIELHPGARTGPRIPARDRITWEWRTFGGDL